MTLFPYFILTEAILIIMPNMFVAIVLFRMKKTLLNKLPDYLLLFLLVIHLVAGFSSFVLYAVTLRDGLIKLMEYAHLLLFSLHFIYMIMFFVMILITLERLLTTKCKPSQFLKIIYTSCAITCMVMVTVLILVAQFISNFQVVPHSFTGAAVVLVTFLPVADFLIFLETKRQIHAVTPMNEHHDECEECEDVRLIEVFIRKEQIIQFHKTYSLDMMSNLLNVSLILPVCFLVSLPEHFGAKTLASQEFRYNLAYSLMGVVPIKNTWYYVCMNINEKIRTEISRIFRVISNLFRSGRKRRARKRKKRSKHRVREQSRSRIIRSALREIGDDMNAIEASRNVIFTSLATIVDVEV